MISVVLVGRANVGKSTLFNRLTKSSDALVSDFPGLTRDRKYGIASISERRFIVVDTGGIEDISYNSIDISDQMMTQSDIAIDESDIIVFVVDGKSGLTAQDFAIASHIRRYRKTVYVAINKADHNQSIVNKHEFYELGLGAVFCISASHGHGVSDLFENILREINIEDSAVEPAGVKLAIVGRPNAGKSTLVNSILGDKRMITSNVAGTTVDSVSSTFTIDGQLYVITDTAGIRKKSNVNTKVEKFSIIKTMQAIDKSSVVIVMFDTTVGVTNQDLFIVNHVINRGKGLIIACNKWDACLDKNTMFNNIKYSLRFAQFIRFCYISALNRDGIKELLSLVREVYNATISKLSTPKLNRVLREAVIRRAPQYKRSDYKPKLLYAHQHGDDHAIVITVHGRNLDKLLPSYTKYLENKFRDAFGLISMPIRINYINKDNPYHNKS